MSRMWSASSKVTATATAWACASGVHRLVLKPECAMKTSYSQVFSGLSWREPADIIDRRDCATNSLEAAAAEAWAWLVETQKHAPARGATHYRVIGEQRTVVGGPPDEVG